jgi:hypothetical protein
MFLHRPDIGQAKKAAQFLRRTVDIEFDLHAAAPLANIVSSEVGSTRTAGNGNDGLHSS